MAHSIHPPLMPDRIDGMMLMPVGPTLWRVVDPTGRAVGHVLVDGDGGERRFVARRFRIADHAFRDVGAFWTLREAIECLRFSR